MQGVGFRPMLYQYANQRNLKGFVCNANDGLHFEFNSLVDHAQDTLYEILAQAPILARINKYSIKRVNSTNYTEFKIEESNGNSITNILLTGFCYL